MQGLALVILNLQFTGFLFLTASPRAPIPSRDASDYKPWKGINKI